MFSKKKNAPHPHIDCLINADTVINGDIIFTGGLRVDGTVNGNILTHESKSGTLIVSQQAKVEGRVAVTHAVINGEVQGDIIAQEFLELEAHARVSGNITYHTLEMHHGAIVSGKLTHAIRVEQSKPEEIIIPFQGTFQETPQEEPREEPGEVSLEGFQEGFQENLQEDFQENSRKNSRKNARKDF
ncbi:MAG: polymer-forming cytoskeletal protein [Burkholderiales bacterium]|jgi:cytoskeletal protein CcmA (bactofilin family)|nr:polymer-forming cytoskeletal protein [Burkholderiales bacterium]